MDRITAAVFFVGACLLGGSINTSAYAAVDEFGSVAVDGVAMQLDVLEPGLPELLIELPVETALR